ncbi:MAG: WhiB family transcriptional regulator [Actinomycetota bacterium]|nr:WhiB family transcriptional regulator [Actinomycetota bacterium]
MRIATTRAAPVRTDAPALPACALEPELFLHPSLEAPPSRSRVSTAQWREHRSLLARARRACAECPMLAECLYTAVAQVDVAGFMGCTTPRERKRIRDLLKISVADEDLDVIAGVRGDRRPVDHDAVVAMRAAHPDESLDQIALRLECSLSTVKRHLRRARRDAQVADHGAAGARPTPSDSSLPTVDDVLDAFDEVVEPDRE